MMSNLDDLLSSLPGFSVLTDGMKNAALAGSLIPDSHGVWPGEDGYEDTHDIYFAALNLISFLQAQPVVTNTNSESTGVTVTVPDWSALRRYYMSQSPIIQGSGYGVITRVEIPDLPYISRTDMRGREDHYGDVDTDLG